ncbi:MAG: SHOCT domain-containing protein [Chloroflexi bacterium]|nr:SHOCT domain-containing protein [Chloroflexota bacterium]
MLRFAIFGWWLGLHLLGNLLWIALLVLLVVALVRWLTRASGPTIPFFPGNPVSQPSAMEILQQRYARGEIDAVTFDQMRERLQASAMAGQRQS